MPQHQQGAMRRYDIYARFPDSHLRTRAEQAVYLTLVSQEAQSWSAAERLRAPSGSRYQWRSDMNYLFGDVDDSPEWVDPVCGMLVTGESPYQAWDSLGRPRRFCCSRCLVTFRALPGVFSGPPVRMGESV